jgi:hypothetical protein
MGKTGKEEFLFIGHIREAQLQRPDKDFQQGQFRGNRLAGTGLDRFQHLLCQGLVIRVVFQMLDPDTAVKGNDLVTVEYFFHFRQPSRSAARQSTGNSTKKPQAFFLVVLIIVVSIAINWFDSSIKSFSYKSITISEAASNRSQ